MMAEKLRLQQGEKNTSSSSSSKDPWSSSKYPFASDYNDHFETPLSAYQDIQPILDAYLATLPLDQRILYDPYYCNGRTQRLLSQLGYDRVLHDCRDFYTKPRSPEEYAILITNPPFSDDHKQRCLDFCVASGRPWLILLPAYCVTKQYVTQKQRMIRFRIPSTTYHYDHPESTGHTDCPFGESIWLCGGFPLVSVEAWTTDKVEAVAQRLRVHLGNRPNPKQRRKKRKSTKEIKGETNSTQDDQAHKNKATTPNSAVRPTKKKSKYRDTSGKRTRGRF